MPVDFTTCSRKAVQYAIGLARGQRAKVTLLHVVDLNFNWPDTGPVNVAKFREEMWAEAAEKLGRLVQALGSAGVLVCPVIREGAPWEETVAFAESNEVDLIILGQRPRRHGWQLFRRHTAKRIAETASCPVLVLLEKDSSAAVPRSLRSVTSVVP